MKISFFKNQWKTKSPEEMMVDMSWDKFAVELTTFIEIPIKEQTEMYNLWEFKVIDGHIHRCADDCVMLHGLVLDYDKNLSLNDALLKFCDFECVIYTTYNHAPGNDRFRVVLPFFQPLTHEQFILKRKSMIETFEGVDTASFSRSQAIFLHSGANSKNAFACRFNGIVLDPNIFEDEVIEPIVYAPAPLTDMDPVIAEKYKTSVIESLFRCSGIRHLDSLSLAIILKSCGANFANYCAIVQAAGAPDSCIQDPKKQIETWNAVANDVKISRIKRDNFITKFGGKLLTPRQQRIQQLRSMV